MERYGTARLALIEEPALFDPGKQGSSLPNEAEMATLYEHARGAILSRYEITGTPHENQSTWVSRAFSLPDRQPVILKFLKPEAAKERLARFRREYEILCKAAGTAGVVKVHGLEELGGGLVMVLEDIGGTSLDMLKAALPAAEFLNLAIGLAGTLAKLHHLRITHKAIRPEHIVLNRQNGRFRLVGFGSADELPELNVAFQPPSALFQPSLAYISPEQTGRMNRAVDYRTDFYSLGVTYYQLLTGNLPFVAEDNLGLLHCHIAVNPDPLHKLDPAIPETLSRIVLKLMAKMAEDRYQSADGLQADLGRCRRELSEQGSIAEFDLGRQDCTDRLRVPQKLYGRDQEFVQLFNVWERVRAGERELVLVAGYSGVGKTSLVLEIQRPVVEAHGYFLKVKFDQLQRNVPYYAWAQAVRGLVNALLTESETQLARLRKSILQAVGNIGRVLTEVIPNLELIVGSQPEVPALGGDKARNRLRYVFVEFVRALATDEHPLVLFLDDMQWTDAASLSLLEALFGNSLVSHLLVIGAYRDNEVDALHPLALSMEQLRKENVRTHLLRLQELSESAVDELVADVLHAPPARTIPMAHLLYSKTGGNPFFLLQTLRELAEQKAIAFDIEQRRWLWEMTALESRQITDNVVTLMLGKIRQLPPETQQTLPLAACLGFRFGLGNLAVIGKQPDEKVLELLYPALREELLVPAGNDYQFAHDRIQQAAYELIPEAERKRVHLEIGCMLRQCLADEDYGNQLFTVVDHLNNGLDLLTTTDERLGLARLNLRAGLKAKASAAFSAAARYCETGVTLLQGACWESDYELALELHTLAAEMVAVAGNFERTDQLFAAIVQHARDPVDMAGAFMSRMMAFSAQGRLPEFVDCALDILRRLGVPVQAHPAPEDIRRALAEVRSSYDPGAIGSLVGLPAAEDPRMIQIMRVLDLAQNSAYSGRPDLFAAFALEAARRTIHHGRTPESMHAFTHVSLLLCGLPGGDLDEGYNLGMVAMALAEQAKDSAVAPTVMATTAGMIWPFKRALREAPAILRPLYPRLKEVGNFEFAGYAACWYASNGFLGGMPLSALEAEMAEYHRDMKRIRAEVGCRWLSPFWQAAQNLLGKSTCPWILDGAAYPREIMLRTIVETGNLAAQTALHVNTLVLCYLFGRYEEAFAAATLTEGCRAGMVAMPIEPPWYFYDSLTRLALYSQASELQKQEQLARVGSNQAYLDMRARYAPMNFMHQWHLVEAEKAWVLGRTLDEAMEHFDTAIALAGENGFIQDQALANERCARFWLEKGKTEFAKVHLRNAHEQYAQWQAWAKVKALEREFPWLESTSDRQPEGRAVSLDLETVMKAAHAISSEMELDRLLNRVMHSVIENAGAQCGYLLLEEAGHWSIAVEGGIGRSGVQLPQSTGAEVGEDVAMAVIQFVARALQTVVLEDAANQGEFINDPHIRRHGIKSLLCAPLLSRGRLIAILYLENNLTTHAFTPGRVELLQMLLSQAATSIENARVYTKLKESEEGYRQIVATANEGILVVGPDTLITFVNRRFADLLGYAAEDLVGQPQTSVMFAEDIPDHNQKVGCRRQGLSEHYERRLRRKDGQTVWTHVSATPILDEHGQFRGSFAMLTDITERKRAEEALRRSEVYRAEAERLSRTGSWALDVASDKYAYYSEELFRISGFDPQQGLPAREPVFRRIHPEDRAWMERSFQKCLREKVDTSQEYRLMLPDGTIRHLHGIRHPVLNGAGDVVELVGTATDITERKEAEEALRRTAAYLAEGQRLSHTGSWAFDVASNKYLYVSEEYIRIFEMDAQDVLPNREAVTRHIHPEDWGRVQGSFEKTLRERVDTSVEFRIVLPSGTAKHILAIRHPVMDDAGDVVKLVGTVMDITERKRAEEALRESETRFRTFVDHAADAFFMLDFEQATIVDVNRCACESLGYTRDELIGTTPLAFDVNLDRAAFGSVAERAAAGETVLFGRHWHRRKDGSLFPVEVQASAFRHGGRRFLLKIARDISDRIRAEEQRERLRQLEADLAHTHRVSMMGELTASLAHELNQPITAVITSAKACLRWLDRDVPELQRASAAARRIERDGTRAAEIIGRVRAFYKKGAPPQPELLDVNEVAREMAELLRSEATKYSISMRSDLDGGLPGVKADRVQLQQVFMNLMLNGIEAMQETAGELTIKSQLNQDGEVLISVSDTGVGLPAGKADRIFDVFFTTKERGTGMGLAISRSIVEAHSGRLWATARDGRGTTFHFTLPTNCEALA